jgi:adenosylhomocysteine nucleosidase
MIGIIGAMAVEVESFIKKLSGTVTEKHSGISYIKGSFNGTEVVAAQCGMGKVNAAICAQTMILMYSPKIIINTGVAGAISPKVKIGDIIIAKSAVQHDLDITPLGIEKGFITEINQKFIPCAPDVIARLENAARKFGNCYTGVIASGDQFISSGETKTAIANDFGALACEMEGASIAHVCALNNVAFGIARTISDNADDDSNFDFNEFLQEYGKKSAEIVSEFIKDM